MAYLGLSEERVARNDAAFRTANEGINAAATEHGLVTNVPFICECADPRCTETVRLSLDEYSEIRERGGVFFFNVPGHEVSGGPAVRVVEERPTYLIVEKLGRAAEIADELDPRADGG